MIGGAFMFALMSACVRALRFLPFMEIVFLRSLLGTLMVGACILLKKGEFFGTKKKLLVLRGAAGFLALSTYYFTVTRIPLATANLLNNTAPIFIAVLAWIYLKERITPKLFALILCCLAGVVLLVRPELRWNPVGCTVGIISAIFTAIAIIYIPQLKEEHPLTIIFYFVSISTLASAPWALSNWVTPDPGGWFLIAAIAITSFFGQLFLTTAFQSGPASVISAVGYTGPVFAWILGILFFNELLTPVALAGAGIIVTSGALLSFIEGKTIEPPDYAREQAPHGSRV